MADQSLDDFFAKKDKSKKKKNPDKVKKKKKKAADSSAEAESTLQRTSAADDAEWNDFEDTEADYTGLKIQNLQISARDGDDDKEDGGERKSDEEDEDENGEKRDSSAQGPWNKSAPSQPLPPPEPEPPKPKEEEIPAATKPGKYIPPAARQAMQSGPAAAGGMSRLMPRKKKQAPDLHSDQDFPTLGCAPNADGDTREFQRVVAGGKQTDDVPGSRGPQLQLDNKYTALSSADN